MFAPPEPIKPEPVDLSPVLDAIKAIVIPEPITQDTTSIDALTAKVEALAAVEAPKVEPVDLAPIQQSIDALSDKVEAMEEPRRDDSAIVRQIVADAIKPLADQVAALSAKPDPKEPDLSAIMREVNQAIANIPKQAQPVMLIDPQTGAIKKQITLTYGDDGKPNGALVEQTGAKD